MKNQLLSILIICLIIASCGNDKKKENTEAEVSVIQKISTENEYKDRILELIDEENSTYTTADSLKIIPLKNTFLLVKREKDITDAEMDDVITLNVYHTNESGIKPIKLSFNMIDVIGKSYFVNDEEYYVAELNYKGSADISVVQVGQYNLQEKKSQWNFVIPSKKILEK